MACHLLFFIVIFKSKNWIKLFLPQLKSKIISTCLQTYSMKVVAKSLTVFLGLTVCGISGYLLYLLLRQEDEDDLIDTFTHVSKFKTLEIKVPKDMVRALIGRNGKSIKLIQEQSNTRINFKEREGCEKKICIIRGSIEACNIAENLIQEFINNQPVLESEDIWVPIGCVGKIIGMCGDKILEIRSLSGAKVTVVDDNKEFTLKRITIKGTKEQIDVAKSLIEDIVETSLQSQQRMEATLSRREPRLPPKSHENLKIDSPKVERISPVPDMLSLWVAYGRRSVYHDCTKVLSGININGPTFNH